MYAVHFHQFQLLHSSVITSGLFLAYFYYLWHYISILCFLILFFSLQNISTFVLQYKIILTLL